MHLVIDVSEKILNKNLSENSSKVYENHQLKNLRFYPSTDANKKIGNFFDLKIKNYENILLKNGNNSFPINNDVALNLHEFPSSNPEKNKSNMIKNNISNIQNQMLKTFNLKEKTENSNFFYKNEKGLGIFGLNLQNNLYFQKQENQNEIEDFLNIRKNLSIKNFNDINDLFNYKINANIKNQEIGGVECKNTKADFFNYEKILINCNANNYFLNHGNNYKNIYNLQNLNCDGKKIYFPKENSNSQFFEYLNFPNNINNNNEIIIKTNNGHYVNNSIIDNNNNKNFNNQNYKTPLDFTDFNNLINFCYNNFINSNGKRNIFNSFNNQKATESMSNNNKNNTNNAASLINNGAKYFLGNSNPAKITNFKIGNCNTSKTKNHKSSTESLNYSSTTPFSKLSNKFKLLGKKTKKTGISNNAFDNKNNDNIDCGESKKMQMLKIKTDTKIFNNLIIKTNQKLTNNKDANTEASGKRPFALDALKNRKSLKNNKLVYVLKNYLLFQNNSINDKENYSGFKNTDEKDFNIINNYHYKENGILNAQSNKEASTGDFVEICSQLEKKEEFFNELIKSNISFFDFCYLVYFKKILYGYINHQQIFFYYFSFLLFFN
jgi:hypothetical protein